MAAWMLAVGTFFYLLWDGPDSAGRSLPVDQAQYLRDQGY
jgi:hypothetical protein